MLIYSDSARIQYKASAPQFLKVTKGSEKYEEYPKGILVISYDKEGKELGSITAKYAKKLEDEMKRLYDEIANMKEDELPAIRDRKTREFSDHQNKVQQFEQTAMQDTQAMYQKLMQPIVQKVRTAIEAVGKEGGYSLIQDKNPQNIIYFDAPVVDITADVKAKLGITL